MLIDTYNATGQLREASRLSQAGSAGYPTDENMFTLAALLNIQIELNSRHTLTCRLSRMDKVRW